MKVVKIAVEAGKSMRECAQSLFYDRDRNSSFYFNKEYENHYGDLMDLFVEKIPDITDEALKDYKYSWFLRQCLIINKSHLDTVNVSRILFGGLVWYAFYITIRHNFVTEYIIIHFSYLY